MRISLYANVSKWRWLDVSGHSPGHCLTPPPHKGSLQSIFFWIYPIKEGRGGVVKMSFSKALKNGQIWKFQICFPTLMSSSQVTRVVAIQFCSHSALFMYWYWTETIFRLIKPQYAERDIILISLHCSPPQLTAPAHSLYSTFRYLAEIKNFSFRLTFCNAISIFINQYSILCQKDWQK